MDEKGIDLRQLNEIYREEIKKKIPCALDSDFYARCQDYFSSLNADIEKEEKAGSMGPRAAMLREELGKAKKTLETIYSIRQRKILLMAYSIQSGEDVNTSLLTVEEKQLFEELLALLREGHERSLGDRPEGRKGVRRFFSRRQKREDAAAEETKKAPAAATVHEKQKKVEDAPANPIIHPAPAHPTAPRSVEEKAQLQVVVVMENIPPFMGYDMDYDLKPQDMALLPKNMVAILEKSGKVRTV